MATKKQISKTSTWQNRIVSHGVEEADQLLADPRNWRIHPSNQQKALGRVLDRVGWVQEVIVNQRTGFVVDGHLRVALAITKGEKVPVAYVDLSDEEEALILATFDPITGLAATDEEILSALKASAVDGFPDMDDVLEELHGGSVEPSRGVDAGDTTKPIILKSARLDLLTPSAEEMAVLAGRKVLVAYSGGKDSGAAAVWVAHYLPDSEKELVFVDMGADHVGLHLFLYEFSRWIGAPLKILRSDKTILELMLEKGAWPRFNHPYCHDLLHDTLDRYFASHDPDSVVIVRGGRAAEKAARSKLKESRFLTVDRLPEYKFFQPFYFADKDSSEVVLEESGAPVWSGYQHGLQRTACRICPGQSTVTYAAIRANFPDVWEELLQLEGKFGPGCWSDIGNQGQGRLADNADRGEKTFRKEYSTRSV